METPELIVKKSRPFFLNYFNNLANDLNTLTAAPVVCTLKDISLMRGELDLMDLFEQDRSVAFVREDGHDTGDVHLIFDITTSIALTGLMMMMGEAVIQSQVKNREYNEEIQEGFQEVSNQVVGALNDLVEKKMPDGSHMFLESTVYTDIGEIPGTLNMEATYLCAQVEIQVADFSPAIASWIFSRGVASVLTKTDIPGTPEEEAASQGASAAKAEEEAAAKAAAEKAEAEAKAKAEEEARAKAEEEARAKAEAEAAAAATAEETAGADAAGGVAMAGEDGIGTLDSYEYSGEERELLDGFTPDKSGQRGVLDPTLAANADAPGSVRKVMTIQPFSLKETHKVIEAITAMRQDGHRYIGIESHGKLIRVISQSDLRQIMGPFFGTKAMSPRDKAICTIPLGKINESQQLVRIPQNGTVNQAANLMTEFGLYALPVISDTGGLRGFVPIHAVLDFFRGRLMTP